MIRHEGFPQHLPIEGACVVQVDGWFILTPIRGMHLPLWNIFGKFFRRFVPDRSFWRPYQRRAKYFYCRRPLPASFA